MKIFQSMLFVLLLLPIGTKAEVFDQIRTHRVGIALSNSSIFADSSFTSNSTQYFKAGTLLTVIKESNIEHEDNAQKQLFKWYKVKSNDGQRGWIYGESMLIKEKENFIPETLKPFYYRKYRFNAGFEKSMVWFGSIVGRDNFGSKMMARTYEESYLIITNDLGNSVYIPIASLSQFGQSEVTTFSIQELTGDQIPDFVLQTKIKDLENQSELNLVQLFTFQAGTLVKIFEESLNVNSKQVGLKHLIFEKQRIRGYYFDHSTSSPQIYSFTYFWNNQRKQFDLLYPASPSIIRAYPNSNGLSLKRGPDNFSPSIKRLTKASQLRIKRVIQKRFVERGKAYQKLFAEVQTSNGLIGFVPLQFLKLKDFKSNDWVYANLQSNSNKSLASIQLPVLPQDTSSIQH